MDEYIEKEEANQRKKKQDYLRQNILESDFDPAEFSEFITSRKEEGQNVDNWEFEELETLVAIFKR